MSSTPPRLISVRRPACPFKAFSPRQRTVFILWPQCNLSLVDRGRDGKVAESWPAGITAARGNTSKSIIFPSQTQNLDLNCSSFPVQHPPEVQSMDWTTKGNAMASLTINGKTIDVDVEPDTPLLWAIRENIGLTGTKYGCGIAQCGACTVHIDGVAMRSCGVLVGEASGKQITTIEGLAAGDGALHKVQQAWIANDVPQCGYCQSGMIMAVAALLKEKPKPTDQDIDEAITNICRCGTFQQVREAIHAAANV
jgi:isoquinoline 1-oxidoreductase subunit alpha